MDVKTDGEINESECNVREKPVVYESGYLLYSSTDQLWEPFIVAQLSEEAMAADYDHLSPF